MDARRRACHACYWMGKCGLALILSSLLFWACGGRTDLYGGPAGDGTPRDGGPDPRDGGPDSSVDSGVDSGLDAGVDAEPDGSVDAGMDADPDGSVDAEPDVVDPPELMLECPTGIDDERLPYGFVGEEFTLDGGDFIIGDVVSWSWTVMPAKCDEILPVPRYGLLYPQSQVARFRPARPGSYRVVLTATPASGQVQSCEFDLPVQGRGLRVELCWDTSTSTDLDLAVHNPFNDAPWYNPAAPATALCGLDGNTCNVVNCNPEIRSVCQAPATRVDWGYPDSPLEFCDPFSSEAGFIDLGFCPNPRASTDNNQSLASGTAEVVQLDNPKSGERFRIMVQNFNNAPATPRVFVYCARAEATFLSPGTPPDFVAPGGGEGATRYGTMWRPADIEMWVDESGTTVGCQVDPLYLNGDPNQGPYVTIDDPSY